MFYQHPHHWCHLPGVGQLLSVLPGTGQWRRKNWNLCSMSGCLVASHRKFRDATHERTFFKLSIQVGGDALPCENLHLLSLSLHPAHSWLGTIKGTADERYPVQRDHTTGAWDRLGVLCGSLLGSLSEGWDQTWPTVMGPPCNSTTQAAQITCGKNNTGGLRSLDPLGWYPSWFGAGANSWGVLSESTKYHAQLAMSCKYSPLTCFSWRGANILNRSLGFIKLQVQVSFWVSLNTAMYLGDPCRVIIIRCVLCVRSCSVVSDSLQPRGLQSTRLPRPWDSPGKNTEGWERCHSLLQGVFPTWWSNPRLLHCRRILYPLSHLKSLGIVRMSLNLSSWRFSFMSIHRMIGGGRGGLL